MEKNLSSLLASIRFKSSMFTHAKVLWSWGVTCENCPPRVYIYPSCWSLSSFQIGLSWQEEEFKMFSLAAISIKAWLSFPKYFFSSFLSWLEGKEGQKQCACNQRKREQSFGPCCKDMWNFAPKINITTWLILVEFFYFLWHWGQKWKIPLKIFSFHTINQACLSLSPLCSRRHSPLLCRRCAKQSALLRCMLYRIPKVMSSDF